MSADKESTQASFRREIGAEFSFVSDPAGELIRNFGVKTPLVTFAKRTTFVIGKERKILYVDHGNDSIDSSKAASACSLY